MSIFVDTGAWYAIADASDRHHERASQFYVDNVEGAERPPLVTSIGVLAETWALLSAHLGRSVALEFWQTLRELRIPVLMVEPVDLEAAWRIIEAFPDQRFSLVDGTSFALMERLGITDAFAFDAHFLIYRFGPGRQRAFRRLPD